MDQRRPLLALLFTALLVHPAAAGSISISITPTLQVGEQAVTAHIAVRNSGDEAAQSVTPLLFFGEHQVRGEARAQLGAQESMQDWLTLQVGELGSGRWPYRVAVDYTDTNQYPFQALHAGLITIGAPPPAKVIVAEIKTVPLASDATLRVKLKNLAGIDRIAKVSVSAPEGIEVTSPPAEISIPAWGEAEVKQSLVNRTALAGSRYPLFASVEYDDTGVHQASIGQGLVEIRAKQSFFETWRTALWIGAAAFVIVWLGFLLWRATAPRHRRAETRP